MNIQQAKYLLISVAVIFGIGFTALIAVFVINPYVQRQKVLQEVTEKEALQKKQIADSLAVKFSEVKDSLIIERIQDSVIHNREKESLLIQFNKKVKKYETRIAGIDTVSDEQFNGSFSARQMLSDSACEVW